jgi:hypothetical protein
MITMPPVPLIAPHLLQAEGLHLAGFEGDRLHEPSKINTRRWRAWYGASPASCSQLLYDLETRQHLNGLAAIADNLLKYFFMALYFLVTNANEHIRAGTWRDNEDTSRDRTWDVIRAIQELEAQKITWPVNDGTILVFTVDGTHSPIEEPRKNPNSNWCSHKFHGPGLAYELAIAVHEPKLVWINGPFRGGESDRDIFMKPNGLQSKLLPGQRAIGDRGYAGLRDVSTNNIEDDRITSTFKRRARARHESFNSRIKRFAVTSTKFRGYHDHNGETCHDSHRTCFVAVCVIVQYEMENGSPLFAV